MIEFPYLSLFFLVPDARPSVKEERRAGDKTLLFFCHLVE